MTDAKQKEVWKTYPEYHFIEVSNLGRVRTKDRVVTRSDGSKLFIKGRVLKQQRDRYGYMFVQFSVSGKRVTLKTHRMVAICFVLNPDNLPQVNHIDCNKHNNNAINLEWVTAKENTEHAYINNLITNRKPIKSTNI